MVLSMKVVARTWFRVVEAPSVRVASVRVRRLTRRRNAAPPLPIIHIPATTTSTDIRTNQPTLGRVEVSGACSAYVSANTSL